MPTKLHLGFGVAGCRRTRCPAGARPGQRAASPLRRVAHRGLHGAAVGPAVLAGRDSFSPTGVSADGSVIVGASDSALGNGAFLWTAAGGLVSLGFLPGRDSSGATGVSADGSVVVGGNFSSEKGSATADVLRAPAVGGVVGRGAVLGGGSSCLATGVSADGSVVVGASDSALGNEAFRWTAAGGMRSLHD